MADSGAIRAGRAFVELFADDSKLSRGLKMAEGKLRAWGKGIGTLGASLAAAGAAITGPILGAAAAYVDAASSIGKMSLRTGIAVEELSALVAAAQRSGVEVESLETGLKKMERSIYDAQHGSAELRDTFRQLGVSLSSLKGLTPDEQLKKLADAFLAIEEPGKRAALAMKIFGRGGTDMLPFLLKGRDGIEALEQRVRDLGQTLGFDDVQVAKAFKATMADLKGSLLAVTYAIGSAVVPAMTRLRALVMPYVAMAVKWVKENKAVFDTLLDLGTVLVVAGVGLGALGTAVYASSYAVAGLWMAIRVGVLPAIAAIKLLSLAFTILHAAMLGPWPAFVGLIAAATAVAVGYGFAVSEQGTKARQSWVAAWDEIASSAKTAWGGIIAAVSAGDFELAFKIISVEMQIVWAETVGAMKKTWAEFIDYIDRKWKSSGAFMLSPFAGYNLSTGEFGSFGSVRLPGADKSDADAATAQTARELKLAKLKEELDALAKRATGGIRVHELTPQFGGVEKKTFDVTSGGGTFSGAAAMMQTGGGQNIRGAIEENGRKQEETNSILRDLLRGAQDGNFVFG